MQVLLDPSSLGDKDLYEIRGKAYMLRLIQEMPRLVEESLKDFEAQRLGATKGEEDAGAAAVQ